MGKIDDIVKDFRSRKFDATKLAELAYERGHSEAVSESVDKTLVQGILNLVSLERWAIEEALILTHGSVLKAAPLLGIGKTTLYRKVYEYGLNGGDVRCQLCGGRIRHKQLAEGPDAH